VTGAATDWTALDALPDPAVVVAPDGTVVHATPLLGRLLRRAANELAGRPVAEAVPLLEETGRDWWACRRPLDPDPVTRRLPETELTLVDHAGGHRPVLLTARRAAGEQAALVVVLRRGERRRRLDAARSELVSTVSHELRSPLTSVKGFVKTLLTKWEQFTDAQRRQMLATVDADADRVTRLLGELLDVSRIDAGRLPLRRSMIDLADVADQVIQRIDASDPHDRVVVDLPDDLPLCYADADRLQQVLTNLVENALTHGDGAATVTADVDDAEVTVSVADEGPGLDPAHLPRLFTKFYRPTERRTGTGLGLYICRGIIEAHGGRVWAESPPSGGARFRFTLPRGTPEALEAPS
jgi:signal transduction histidine kinase